MTFVKLFKQVTEKTHILDRRVFPKCIFKQVVSLLHWTVFWQYHTPVTCYHLGWDWSNTSDSEQKTACASLLQSPLCWKLSGTRKQTCQGARSVVVVITFLDTFATVIRTAGGYLRRLRSNDQCNRWKSPSYGWISWQNFATYRVSRFWKHLILSYSVTSTSRFVQPTFPAEIWKRLLGWR